MSTIQGLSKRKTKKYFNSDTLAKIVKESWLNGEDIQEAIKPPNNSRIQTKEEWLALNTFYFFNQTNIVYSLLPENVCTVHTCKVMSAGPRYQYLWADGQKVKKPIKVSAPQYITFLMDWVESLLEDKTIFPSQSNDGGAVIFPENFLETIKQIFKRLLRVYAHIYHSHLDAIREIQKETTFNNSFKHFYFFIQAYDLVTIKEVQPLKGLIETITTKKSLPLFRKKSGNEDVTSSEDEENKRQSEAISNTDWWNDLKSVLGEEESGSDQTNSPKKETRRFPDQKRNTDRRSSAIRALEPSPSFGSEYTIKRQSIQLLEILAIQQDIQKWIELVLDEKLPNPDLLTSLRDGVALCKLMEKISPGSIKKEPHHTNTPFLMMNNVELFINACKEYGLQDFFTPDELVNNRNLNRKVILLLRDFAQLATKKGFQPPFIATPFIPPPMERSDSVIFIEPTPTEKALDLIAKRGEELRNLKRENPYDQNLAKENMKLREELEKIKQQLEKEQQARVQERRKLQLLEIQLSRSLSNLQTLDAAK